MNQGSRSRMVDVPAVSGATVGVARFSSKPFLQMNFSTTLKELTNMLSSEFCSR